MADKRWYLLERTFTLPAHAMVSRNWDGIYIDGDLFENNIPVVDCVAWLQVTPSGKRLSDLYCIIGFPTFDKAQNKVIRLGHNFWWPPLSEMPLAEKLFYNGNPYGMGLNTISVVLQALPGPNPMNTDFDVSIILEVDI